MSDSGATFLGFGVLQHLKVYLVQHNFYLQSAVAWPEGGGSVIRIAKS